MTGTRVGTGMPLRAVCEASIRVSDNTAANLVFAALGGPGAAQALLRELGDDVTRLDRTEPELNEAARGDDRDTSTPLAMADTVEALLLGDALPPGTRDLLVGWAMGNATGDTLVRAGAPAGWTVADKSGSGSWGTRNDVAVAWPPTPSSAPVVVAVLSDLDTQDAGSEDVLVAEAAAVAFAELGR